jgi:hypothetical protein
MCCRSNFCPLPASSECLKFSGLFSALDEVTHLKFDKRLCLGELKIKFKAILPTSDRLKDEKIENNEIIAYFSSNMSFHNIKLNLSKKKAVEVVEKTVS